MDDSGLFYHAPSIAPLQSSSLSSSFKRDLVSTIRPLTYAYRFFGFAPYSSDLTPGRTWSLIGVLCNLVWSLFAILYVPYYVLLMNMLINNPAYCGIFGTMGFPYLVGVILTVQSLLYATISLIFAKRSAKLACSLNEALVEGLGRLRRAVIGYVVSIVVLILLAAGFAVVVTSAIKVDVAIETMFGVKKGSLLFVYYYFCTCCYFILDAYGWIAQILNTSVHVLLSVAFIQQFRYIERNLRSATCFEQYESLRMHYFFLRRCLSHCDDVISYTALLCSSVTICISCVTVNATVIWTEATMYHYLAIMATVLLQVVGFCSVMLASIWMNEKVKTIAVHWANRSVYHPPSGEIGQQAPVRLAYSAAGTGSMRKFSDALSSWHSFQRFQISRWLRKIENQSGDLTVGKIFAIDRGSILTVSPLFLQPLCDHDGFCF